MTGSSTTPARRLLFRGLAAAATAGAVGRLFRPGAAQAQSVAWKQAGNNHHVLALQEDAHAAALTGPVKLDYLGHCAFRITSPAGLTLVVDPWRNDPSGAWGLWFPHEFPSLVADIGLSTHTHFDHDAIDRVQATMLLDRLVGTYRFADVVITGVADKHAILAPGWYKWINVVREFGQDPNPPNNPGHLDMSSFLVETGGLRILFWGDNRHNAPDSVWEQWGRVDVLTIPVDGSMHILSYDQANAVIDRLRPKVVIPTHYLAEGVSSTLSTLQTADEWVETQRNRRTLAGASVSFAAEDVAKMDREVFYFGHNVVRA